MSKYNVGDRVKIRSDLIVWEAYDGLEVVDEMKDYIGDILTIKYIDGDGDYFMEENEDEEYMFFWNDAMIECIVK